MALLRNTKEKESITTLARHSVRKLQSSFRPQPDDRHLTFGILVGRIESVGLTTESFLAP